MNKVKKFIVNATVLKSQHSGIARYIKGIYSNWPYDDKNPSQLSPTFFDGNQFHNHLNNISPEIKTLNFSNTVKRIPFSYSLFQSYKAIRFKQKIDPNFLFYHEPNFIPLKSSLPKVITIHDLAFIKYPETIQKEKSKWLNQNIYRSIKNSKLILTVSQTVKNELISFFKIPNDKCHVFPNGIDSIFHKDDHEAFKNICNLKSKSFFLFVGNIEPRKNLEFLLKIYKDPNISFTSTFPLVIIGSEHINPNYAKKLKTLTKNNSNIIWLNNINDKSLALYYKNALALVMPSLYEGFGIPILECLASSTPTIVSDIDIFQEFKINGIFHLSLNSPNSWVSCMESLTEKPYVNVNHKFVIEHYSWSKISSNLNDLFNLTFKSQF